jgi:putative transposase
MSVQRFSIGKQFRWQGILYEVKRLLPHDEINIEDVGSGAVQVVPLSKLVATLFEDDLFFVISTKPIARQTPQAGNRTDHTVECVELSDYPSDLVVIARRRLKIIEPLLALGSHCTLTAVQARIAEVKAEEGNPNGGKALEVALSWRTVYRWLADYRLSGDIRALIPATTRRGGKGRSRLAPEVGALVDSVIRDNYHKPEQVTIKDLFYLVAAAIDEENKLRPADERLPMPAESTINRRVDALDVRERFAIKHCKAVTERQFTQVGKTDYPEKPLERVEMDHTPIDLIVVDEHDLLPLGRLNLTNALDGATRYPLGYYLGFEPPSYYTVMECLHHAIWLKPNIQERYGTEHPWLAYGVPSLLIVDNGKEFIGQDLSDACLQLGITLENAPLQTPEFKAAIGRHFGTCNGLFHTLPGTTFSNIFQRGDYDSTRQACITLSELEKTLHIFLLDIYAERFHKGLQGIPARRWEVSVQAGFSPRLPTSAQELAILLGRVTRRTIHRYGIEFENLRYNSSDLATLRHRLAGEPVKLKYHPGDLSRLYVYDPFNQVYHTVPALDVEYTMNLSLWKHRIICEFVRREQDRVDLAALGRAKRKIQEVVDAAMSRKQQRGGRKIGRWQTSGQPPSLVKNADAPEALPIPMESSPASRSNASDEMVLTSTPIESEEWGLTYNLPKSRSDALAMSLERTEE